MLLLGVAKSLELVHVFLLINGVIREDQCFANCAERIFDAIEIPTAALIDASGTDHIRFELIRSLLQ